MSSSWASARFFRKKALVETYIDESVQGLDVGSPVKFRGVPVGRVEQISLTSAEYATRRQYVLVRMSISSNMFQFPVNDPNSPALKQELDRGFRIRTGGARIDRRCLFGSGLLGSGAESAAGN